MRDAGTSASGLAVDGAGSIYAADVGFNNLRKYVRVESIASEQCVGAGGAEPLGKR
jgi:hypothetical protein